MTEQPRAAIALFLYRRPELSRRVVAALCASPLASSTALYVFCDGPRGPADAPLVSVVRALAKTIGGFRRVSITESADNHGLSGSIRAGVTHVLAAHRSVIVVEDDVVLSPAAPTYFNAMLDRFENHPRVSAIAGFSYPPQVLRIPREYAYDVFFTPRLKSWGWATWRDRWGEVDWSAPEAERVLSGRGARAFSGGGDDLPHLVDLELRGQTDSWAIRWDYHQFRRGRVCVHPRHSYTARIDDGGDGTHGGAVDPSPAPSSLNLTTEWRVPPDVELDSAVVRAYKSVYDRVSPLGGRKLRPSYWRRALERRFRRAFD